MVTLKPLPRGWLNCLILIEKAKSLWLWLAQLFISAKRAQDSNVASTQRTMSGIYIEGRDGVSPAHDRSCITKMHTFVSREFHKSVAATEKDLSPRPTFLTHLWAEELPRGLPAVAHPSGIPDMMVRSQHAWAAQALFPCLPHAQRL